MNEAKYYHEFHIRQGASRTVKKIFGSDAQLLDDAVRERQKIAQQYHKNQIISATTHDFIRSA